jgi:hypothetical protein
MFKMRRREFITLLGGAATAWPLAARAQQVGSRYTVDTVGILTAGDNAALNAVLIDALGKLGWVEANNVVFEHRYAENRLERLPGTCSGPGPSQGRCYCGSRNSRTAFGQASQFDHSDRHDIRWRSIGERAVGPPDTPRSGQPIPGHDWPSGGGKAREHFADHAAIALAHVSDDDGEEGWFTEHYREWQRGFELAADGGAVQVFFEAQV